jgi:hypothetical protein
VKAVILRNGGTSNAKPFLAVSGRPDIGGTTAATMAAGVNGAARRFLFYHNPQGIGGIRGHLVLMLTCNATDPSLNSWQMTLNGDATHTPRSWACTPCERLRVRSEGFLRRAGKARRLRLAPVPPPSRRGRVELRIPMRAR